MPDRAGRVVLPVAPAPEKAGSSWTGRADSASFDATLQDTGQMTDARVLDGLAESGRRDGRGAAPPVAGAPASELAALGRAATPAAPDGLTVGPALRGRWTATRPCWRPGTS